MTSNEPTYPKDHQPAMRVPKGGSSCASCEYLGKDDKTCTSKNYIAWRGSNRLGAPKDEWCSDWYEPAKPKERKGAFFG